MNEKFNLMDLIIGLVMCLTLLIMIAVVVGGFLLIILANVGVI